jgi:hypothetical protein
MLPLPSLLPLAASGGVWFLRRLYNTIPNLQQPHCASEYKEEPSNYFQFKAKCDLLVIDYFNNSLQLYSLHCHK